MYGKSNYKEGLKIKYIYIYDILPGKKSDPVRMKFYKELFGFKYTWKTKIKRKVKRLPGLLDREGCETVGDSAILVPENYAEEYNAFFRKYQDIISCRVFIVQDEVRF